MNYACAVVCVIKRVAKLAQPACDLIWLKDLLSADKLTLRRVRRAAGSLVAHAVSIITNGPWIKLEPPSPHAVAHWEPDEFAGCCGGAKAGASNDLGELPLDFSLLVNEQLRVTDYVHEQDVAQSQGPNASVFPRPSNNSKPATAAVPLRFLCVHGFFSAANSWNDLLFLGDELSAGSLGCGNDFVEALI